MKIEFGLLQTKLTSDEDSECQAKDCHRIISTGNDCFVDTETGDVLCQECGNCERYSRKKQLEREKAGITNVPLIKGLDY